MSSNEKLYKIGTLAELAGISVQTARVYQANGLIAPDWVSPGGTRYYKMETINKFIQESMRGEKL